MKSSFHSVFNKLNIIAILLICFVCFILRYLKKLFGKNIDFEKNLLPRRILIFQGMKLGDMVCTTPMFRNIKEKYQNCHVAVAGNSINRELLQGNMDVDEYIIISKSIFHNSQLFKKGNYDAACLIGTSFSSLAALFISGIPKIITMKIIKGWSPYVTKPYNFLQKFVISVEFKMGNYAPREYLHLLEPLGIYSENTKKYLSYSKDAENKVKGYLLSENINKDDFIVGISPSAGNKVKKWSEEKFAKISDYLIERYKAKIIVIGGKNDAQEVQKMIESVENRVSNASEIFSIDELKALISNMNLFISVDTGPIYIAESFDIPTIDITGPIDENEQPPIGLLHKVVIPPNRNKPELFVMNARVYDKEEALRQSDSISIEMVISAIDDLCHKLGIKKDN